LLYSGVGADSGRRHGKRLLGQVCQPYAAARSVGALQTETYRTSGNDIVFCLSTGVQSCLTELAVLVWRSGVSTVFIGRELFVAFRLVAEPCAVTQWFILFQMTETVGS